MKLKLGKSITKLFVKRPMGSFYILDKTPAEGMLVMFKGNKIELASNKDEIKGVYTQGSYCKMYTLDGEVKEVIIPEGVIFKGEAIIK